MKIFIEHPASRSGTWLSLLAENSADKLALEKLYCDAQEDRGDYAFEIDNNIKWDQQNFKLMFMLQVERGT